MSTSTNANSQPSFPHDWAEAMVGHESTTQAHYIPPDIAKEWVQMCQPLLQPLRPPPVKEEIRETDPNLLQQLAKAMQPFAEQTQAINQLRAEITQVREENRLLRER